MASNPPPPLAGGMSLYANLLDPKPATSASISSAPVLYSQSGNGTDETGAARKDINPALRFQPIRRPQVKQPTKPKPAATSSSSALASASAPSAPSLPPQTPAAAAATAPSQTQQATTTSRTTLADWTAKADADHYHLEQQNTAAAAARQRGGRKNKKKKGNRDGRGGNGNGHRQVETDWDEIYDPARPTNVEEYLKSDERIREVQEWKWALYAHRRKDARRSRNMSQNASDSEDSGDSRSRRRTGANTQFAPPPNMAFAPPPPSPPSAAAAAAPPPPPPDESAEEAYARRLALVQPAPPPPPSHAAEPGVTVSRAPVRYDNSSQPPAVPTSASASASATTQPVKSEQDQDTTIMSASSTFSPQPQRPNKSTFAKRLMSKYGWTAGTGLGASSEGIITPLSVQVEKRRKRPDAEGGGYIDPAGGRARVVGGKLSNTNTNNKKQRLGGGSADEKAPGVKNSQQHAADEEEEEDTSGYREISPVIVLRNMLTNIPSLREEIVSGGLGQEIGEECGDKYGRVERLYFDYADDIASGGGETINADAQVFIKFTDTISALRAVNALQGRVFNGNTIAARFFDQDKFERGIYR